MKPNTQLIAVVMLFWLYLVADNSALRKPASG
jgi:hypothetical protein